MRRIFLALALILAPWVASAATCTANGSGTLTSITAGTSTWSGAGCAGGHPTAGSLNVIPNGISITIAGDITEDATAGAGFSVTSGGALIADTITTAAKDPITITMGDAGITAATGSTLRLLGGYREYGVTPANTVASQSATSYLSVGDVILCPGTGGALAANVFEPDCGGALGTPGNASTVRFDYYSSRWDKANGAYADTHRSLFLADMTTSDVACIFDPDPNDTWSPIDRDFCYKVTAKNSLGFNFDIRQVGMNSDESGYLLANRQVKEIVLAVDHVRGQRTITVPASTIAASGERAGQMIWFQSTSEPCGNGDSTPCRINPHPYRIEKTTDGGAGVDTLLLASLNGLEKDVSATCGAGSCRAWITPSGWEPGDPISVWVPVTLRSATAANRDSGLYCSGAAECTYRAIVLDDTGKIRIGDSIGALSLTDIWQIDPTSTAYAPFVWQNLPAGTWSVVHPTATGGDPDAPGASHLDGKNDYGITMEDQTGAITWNVTNAAYRYITKSCLSDQNNGGFAQTANLERFRCEFSVNGDNAATNVLGLSGGPMTVNGTGLLAINVGNNNSSSFVATDNRADIAVNLSNVVALANTGGFFVANETAQGTFSNLAIIGGTNGTTPALDLLKSSTFTNLLVREWVAGNTGYVVNGATNNNRVNLTNALFRDVSSYTTFMNLRRDTKMLNVALLNATTVSGAGSSVVLYESDSSITAGSYISGLTLAWPTDVNTGFQFGFSNAATDLSNLSLGGLWISGMDYSGGNAIGVNLTLAQTDGGATSLRYTGPLCFGGSPDSDAAANALTGFATAGATVIRDLIPRHLDVLGARLDSIGAGSSCGASNAGLSADFPELRIVGVTPEVLRPIRGASGGWLPRAF